MGAAVSDSQFQVRMEPAACGLCAGLGRNPVSYAGCPACAGTGSFLVAQPARVCGGCGGGGQLRELGTCSVCKGSGWAHALPALAVGSLFDAKAPSPANAANPTDTLAQHVATSAGHIGSDIILTAYAVGYLFALGLNWANPQKNVFECIFVALLSWINVGYLLAGG